jgi:hypothetical protein
MISNLAQAATKQGVVVHSASYTEKPAPRFNGRIYEFEISCNKTGLVLDSVWFGNAPVPCDVFTFNRKEKVTSLQSGQHYIVRCNRDLYSQYPDRFDSVKAATYFKAPFSFRGKAVLLYSLSSQHFGVSVKSIRYRKPQPLRK